MFVYQLPLDQPVPAPFLNTLSDAKTKLASITRTLEEISIVTDIVLEEAIAPIDMKQEEWRCFRMLGPMPFGKWLHRNYSE